MSVTRFAQIVVGIYLKRSICIILRVGNAKFDSAKVFAKNFRPNLPKLCGRFNKHPTNQCSDFQKSKNGVDY